MSAPDSPCRGGVALVQSAAAAQGSSAVVATHGGLAHERRSAHVHPFHELAARVHRRRAAPLRRGQPQYTVKISAATAPPRSRRWREQILSLDDGENPYHRFNYPNPPIMALILRPIVELPGLAGPLVWFYLKVGMALLALHWTVLLVETPEQSFPAWATGAGRAADAAAGPRRPDARQRQPAYFADGRCRAVCLSLPPRLGLRDTDRPGHRVQGDAGAFRAVLRLETPVEGGGGMRRRPVPLLLAGAGSLPWLRARISNCSPAGPIR